MLSLLVLATIIGVIVYCDPLVFTTRVFVHGEEGYPCIRIPAIIKTGSGKLLAFAECRTFAGDNCYPDYPQAEKVKDEKFTLNAHICMKSSTDNGRTWSGMSFPMGKNSWMDDPEPVWDEVTKAVVLHMHVDDKLFQIISLDEGVSWSFPTDHSIPLTPYTTTFPGPATAIQKEFEPNKGRLLWIGHYGSYDKDIVWYSDDHGRSIHMSPSILPEMDEAQLVELNNGTVMANLRNNHKWGNIRAVSVSLDGGEHWLPPYPEPQLIDPICQGSILRDKQSKSIFFSNPHSGKLRVNMTIQRSDDDAKTWTKKYIVGPNREAAYSSLTNTAEKDTIGLLWESNYEKCEGNGCVIFYSLVKSSLE